MRPANRFSIVTALSLGYLVTAAASYGEGRSACPVMLESGEFNQDSVDVTIRNMGKLPVREFELSCAASQGNTVKRTTCHVEEGIFYPGTPYNITFANAVKGPASLVLSLKLAQLSDGSTWTSAHDQPCKSLKVHRKRS